MIRLQSILLFVLTVFILAAFDACKKNQPTAPEPEPETVISPEAQPIDSTNNQLVSVSADTSTFTFDAQSSSVKNLKPNDIMILNVGQGYLRKVSSVQQTPNGIVVQTSPAALTDAIESGSFNTTMSLTPEDVLSSSVAHGVKLKKGIGTPASLFFDIDKVLYDIDENTDTDNDQIRIAGSLEIVPSFNFSIKIRNGKLQDLTFSNAIEEFAELSLEAEMNFLQIDERIEIAQVTFNTFVVSIGPIPVILTPKLRIFIGVEGNAYASFSAEVDQSASFTTAVEYENGSWSSSKNLTNSFSYDSPTLQASLSAKGYVGADLELLVYGVLAPRATAEGYLRFEANPALTPWWSLYGGLSAGMGASVQILGRSIVDYSIPDLLVYEKILASAPTLAPPTVTTLLPSSITTNSAQLNGSVNPNESSTTAWFEYSTNSSLTSYTNSVSQSMGSGTSPLNSNQPINGLLPNTTYYFRAVASNIAGMSRGSVLNLTTSNDVFAGDSGTFVDDRDGNIYKWVKIGNQIWMAENLKYNGFCYGWNSANCDTYGALYAWATAILAPPPGWHLPSDDEWAALVNYLGGTASAGGKMKSKTFWNSPNTGATNESGFSALASGYYAPPNSPYFYNLGNRTIFWSSTQGPDFQGNQMAYARQLDYNLASISANSRFAAVFGFSVRCVKD